MMYNNKKNKELIIGLQSTIIEATSLLDKNQSYYLVILEDEEYLGLIFKEDLIDVDENTVLKELRHLFKPIFLRKDFSLFDWIKISSVYTLKMIPIVDGDDMTFIGLLDSNDVLNKFQNTGLLVESSTVLILKKSSNEFSYSQVFQIAEANDTKIFGSYINSSDENDTEIVLNIYHTGLNELLQSYRRYDYDIVSYHEEDLHHETLKANSDYFTKYLTV